ncbi:EAL domain-containing protein [Herbaspirillum sp. SJZ107]|uniref:sensor domain-containing phosphodiesterase n=1 Tax=Herbaspirillum sp. SJZ107 TaxID=2572881 RepID=UPI00115252BD|nr:EAL domain-containing protein [Herbaspirillum sp. SJZ107]TQK06795.1 EAL domain-containing protein (putative c-di-GMP-specific phosphodiesterase class I) [Herbaspirillum sp. SJZ107]
MNLPLHRPHCEASRLEALRKLNLLDTPPSEAFDRITRMAAQMFNLPIAAVSLTDSDRQWFKSRVGVEHDTIPRMKAPCGQVADQGDMLVIPDLLLDCHYRDSILAESGIRFYAGAPLLTQDGYCLGAMCVLGTEPRAITEPEREALRDLAAMVMAQIELRHALGRVDPFSGLPNRNQFVDDFQDMTADRQQGEERLAALVNLASPEQLSNALRAMGPSYLDEVVGEAVRMLKSTIGLDSTVYHISPTEFVFVARPGTDPVEFCVGLENWLRRRAASLTSRFVTTARIGVAPFTVGVTGYADLLRNLHSAVQHGLDQECGVSMFSQEQDALYQRRFWLVNEFGATLDGAIPGRDGQLRLVFQPKINLATGACIGAEALLRWTHPEFGDVSPGEFIPIIERTSMVRAVTNWVLETAMVQLAEWRIEGLELELAVNVSAVNLLEPDFCVRVIDGLRRHGLPPSSLSLEITESALMQNPKVAQATLRALHAAGVRLAIDDFGTGYSSLTYLQSLPVQVVKIDQGFIRGIESDERKRSLVSAMIKLAHDLGHRVVAEGVETPEVMRVLERVGCDEAQGYLYARPMPPQAFAQWFAERREEVLALA